MILNFKSEFNRFLDYLKLPDNERLIFSAPYGIGKTTFIKNFFKSPSISKEYKLFHLFPANYSISDTDYIFEYIKYDILYQILEDVTLDSESFNYQETIQAFIIEKGANIFSLLFEGISMVNQTISSISTIIKKFEILYNDYLIFHQQMQIDDIKTLDKFRDGLESKIGSIYENDIITKLIQYYIEKIANGDENEPVIKRKPILVIDDLDRIDPEHFFRLLNIFASQVDLVYKNENLKNKFGFYQVMFVFDMDNARNLFISKYGGKVDFNGYFDKFFSRIIFQFQPYNEIKENLSKILDEIIIPEYDYRVLNFREQNKVVNQLIENIIICFLQAGKINLRNLLKLSNKEYKLPKRIIHSPRSNYPFTNRSIVPLIAFDFLVEILGGISNFESSIEAIAHMPDYQTNNYDKFYFLRHLIVILGYDNHKFSSSESTITIEISSVKINYRLMNGNNIIYTDIYDDADEVIQNDFDKLLFLSPINMNTCIYNAFIKCKELGIFS